jgi:hypothetical protein
MWLPWKYAAIFAVVFGVTGFILRNKPKPWVATAAVLNETSLMLVLYGLWRLAGTLSVMKVTHAMDRGRWLWRIERWLPLPSELRVQRWFLPHPNVMRLFNHYYRIVHVPALGVLLLWLFFRHRQHYKPWRNAIAWLTGLSLAIQLIPVAPPRMFPDLGFIDAGAVFGPTVYGRLGTGAADQLSAMPSVHIGWAVLIAAIAISVSKSKWRWLVLLHPLMTFVVVVATGNHWWLDGLVEIALLALIVGTQRLVRRLIARLRPAMSTSLEDFAQEAVSV